MSERPTYKPYLAGTIRRLGSPYEIVTNSQHAWILFAMMFAMQGSSGGASWYPFAVGLIGVGIALTFVTRPNGRTRLTRAIGKLRKALPWFHAHPVTCHALPADDELDAALAAEGYERVTIDGRTITGFDDLAAALQAHTTPMKFPEHGRDRVLSLMAQMSDEHPRRALVLRHATALAATAPAMLATFVADWSAHAPALRPGLLVFVDLPDAPPREREVEAHLARGERSDEPDRAILKDAPEGAWWKPVPGELTR